MASFSTKAQPIYPVTHLPLTSMTHVQLMADVQACRQHQGLTQVALAQQLGISVRTYQEWEQGRRCPSGAAVTLLRGYLHMTTSRH
ncbi:helix-turn-helix domain-containing protein [Halomonas sp. AOP35-4E-18]|uniref:helix-turn-helix domain-containing protein n=1 Tax=Halomonas sp. AOP35-4E-18 TaxID=3457686 RepID=UPI004033A304